MPRKCQGNDGVILPPGDFFEANMMNSVFSELSLNVLDPIHDFSSSIHSFMELNFAARSSLPSAAQSSWMSSAQQWYNTLCLRHISSTDLVYIGYRSGPSTEPWGTPQTTGRV